MKKTIMMLMAAALMVAMPSCKDKNAPEVPPVTIPEGAVALSTLNGIEVDFYPSYSAEGAYDYAVLLYNSKSEDYLPMVTFDILTVKEKSYEGVYSVAKKNLVLEDVSYMLLTANEADMLTLTDGEVAISVAGDTMRVYGYLMADGKAYAIDVKAAYEYYNGEYPFEPEEAANIVLSGMSGEVDPTYIDYGEIDVYASSERYDLQLLYVADDLAENGGIADGSYEISYDDEKSNIFYGGGSYMNFPMGCVLTDYEAEAYYYLVSGKVTISEDGTHCAIDAQSYYGSSVKGEFDMEITEGEEMGGFDWSEIFGAPAKMQKKGTKAHAPLKMVKNSKRVVR